jgi:hypothetical protein
MSQESRVGTMNLSRSRPHTESRRRGGEESSPRCVASTRPPRLRVSHFGHGSRTGSRSLLRTGHHGFHHVVEVEAAGLLARRKLAETLEPLPDIPGRGRDREHVIGEPALVSMPSSKARSKGSMRRFVSMGARSFSNGSIQTFKAVSVLHQERDLPIAIAQRRHAAVVRPVDELLARPGSRPLERRGKVVPVEVHLVGSLRRSYDP